MVREFEEQAEEMGRRSLVKEAFRFAEELGLELDLEHLWSVKTEVRKCQDEKLDEEVRNQWWQGSLVTSRLQDEKLSAGGACGGWQVEDLSNIHNRQKFWIIWATLAYLGICDPEDPYRFGERGNVQVVWQGPREHCAHLVRVKCAGTKQVPLLTGLSVKGTVLRDAFFRS